MNHSGQLSHLCSLAVDHTGWDHQSDVPLCPIYMRDPLVKVYKKLTGKSPSLWVNQLFLRPSSIAILTFWPGNPSDKPQITAMKSPIRSYPLVFLAIENGDRNNEFSHSKWCIFPFHHYANVHQKSPGQVSYIPHIFPNIPQYSTRNHHLSRAIPNSMD